MLEDFGRSARGPVVSAHRMPDEMFEFAERRAARGLRAIIAGAGGAAHLPGMLAAKTTVPVLGVPVPSRHLPVRTRCCRSCRCRPACPSPRSPSARRGDERRAVRSRPARRRRRRVCAAALDDDRADPRTAPQRVDPATVVTPDHAAGDDRDARRRAARPLRAHRRPHDGLRHDRPRPDPAAPAGPRRRRARRRRATTTRRRARPPRRDVRRRHDRVREPAGDGAGSGWPRTSSSRPRRRRWRSPRTAWQEKRVPRRRRGVPTAPFATVDASRRPTDDRLPGDPQDRPPRLRRQGPARRRRRRPRSTAPGASSARCRACSNSASPSTPSSA